MEELMTFTEKQQKVIVGHLQLSDQQTPFYIRNLRLIATEYYKMRERYLPPKQAAAIVRRIHKHSEQLAKAVRELHEQLHGVDASWLLDPVDRCCLRAGEMVRSFPERFPRNQPDWQARYLVYDLLLVWHGRFGKLPSKGPNAPFTKFVQAMFKMLEGSRGGKPPRDSRAIIDAAIEKWKQHHGGAPKHQTVVLEIGTPEHDDYPTNKDAEGFFTAAASLIFLQL